MFRSLFAVVNIVGKKQKLKIKLFIEKFENTVAIKWKAECEIFNKDLQQTSNFSV